MSAHTAALRKCVEALKLIDHADCRNDAVWNAVIDAQAQAERALRDGEKQDQPVVPEGWKVVPIRPTHEMVRAACDAMGATQSVMLAIEKAPPPPFVGALKFDPARLNELIQDAANTAFAAGNWREGDEGQNIYQLIPALDAAKAKLVHHIASLAAPQPAAAPSGDALKFADHIINGIFEGGDWDGGDVQELAVKHGLLKPQTMQGPCNLDGACQCAQNSAEFPSTCYRKTYVSAITATKE